jgi:squalene synthase HpnC
MLEALMSTSAQLSELDRIASGALAQSGAENFPVALRFLRHDVRRQLFAAYSYARFVDDIGDGDSGAPRSTDDRLALLEAVEAEVRRLPSNGSQLAVVDGLRPLVRAQPQILQALLDLIEANRVDQLVSRYADFADLLGYCTLSAAPIGRLVLAIAGVDSAAAAADSDAVCAGLQVLEHCQDVAEDVGRGRIYLPGTDLALAGVEEADLSAGRASPELRQVIGVQVERADALVRRGQGLVTDLRGWAKIAVAGYVAGGLATAEALRRHDFDVLTTQIRPSKPRTATTALGLLLGRGPAASGGRSRGRRQPIGRAAE